MNAKIVLETLAEFSPNVEGRAMRVPHYAGPKPTAVQGPLEMLLPIPVLEDSGFTGYRHWGINE